MTPVREPTLHELLNDPIIHLVMKADGVTKADILDLYYTDEDTPADNPPAYICSDLLKSSFRPEA